MFDPANAEHMAAALATFVHDPRFKSMDCAWALFDHELRQQLFDKFCAEQDGERNGRRSFSKWLRKHLRAFVPKPGVGISLRPIWQHGMAFVVIAETDDAQTAFFGLRAKRVTPDPEWPAWPWRVHNFGPLVKVTND